jgi:crotonobetainyl-CoA:carnitine CoA-transferase CaiB-like acyl-CoA transferase
VTEARDHGPPPGPVGEGPLSGIRLIELASEYASPAGKLFADLGADVVVVEPPGGHRSRSIGPFFNDHQQPEGSLWWWLHNTSKKSISLDLDSDSERRILLDLMEVADVVLESELPGSLDRRGVERERLMGDHPELIWVSVAPFGQTDPRSLEPYTDLTLMASSGPVWNCGYDDHSLPPVRPGGNQTANVSSLHAVLGALVALTNRGMTGMGQHVDVSMSAALNVTTEVATNEWLVAHDTVQRQTGRHASVFPTAPSQVRAADGKYVVLGFPPRAASDYQILLDWLEELDLKEEFPDWVLLQIGVERGGVKIVELGRDPLADQVWNSARGAMEVIASHADANDCFEGFQRRGIVCGIINAPEELLADQQFLARGFPTPVAHPDLDRTFLYPGAPIVFNGSPWRISSRAPQVDEHRTDVLGLIGETE